MAGENLVKVYESQGMFSAEVVKAKLEANGIPALLKYESVGQIIGITIDGLGRVEVHVPTQFADNALDLVREADLDESDADAGDPGDHGGAGARDADSDELVETDGDPTGEY